VCSVTARRPCGFADHAISGISRKTRNEAGRRDAEAASLVSDTITLLFTDIEGSTRRWEHLPEQMAVALARHDAIMRSAIAARNGTVFKTIGDAFCAAFHAPDDGLQAALVVQRALAAEDWGEIGHVRVRIALHTGAVQHRDNDYFGLPGQSH